MNSAQRPLVFLDLETTGTNVATDRIVEIGMIKVNFTSYEVMDQFQQYFKPAIPVSLEAAAVTGITNEFLENMPPFSDIAPAIHAFLSGCNIAGHGIMNFDIPLLVEEFLRVDIEFPDPEVKFIDTIRNQEKLFPRTLSAVYEMLTGHKADERIHSAYYDCNLTKQVFQSQVQKYRDKLPFDIDEYHKVATRDKVIVDYAGCFTKNDKGEIIFNFGKHKGSLVTSERKYGEWMLSQDFTLDTKRWIKKILEIGEKLKGESKISF